MYIATISMHLPASERSGVIPMVSPVVVKADTDSNRMSRKSRLGIARISVSVMESKKLVADIPKRKKKQTEIALNIKS